NFISILIPPSPSPLVFPYTTLFRSETRVTPQQAWEALYKGNQRFMEGALLHPQQSAERRNEISGNQTPNAAFLGCSDSRVAAERSEEHTSELQSRENLVCRLLLEKK